MGPEEAWQRLSASGGGLPSDPVFRRVVSGSVNNVWKVEHGRRAWALRLPGSRAARLELDRRGERALLAAAGREGLAPRVVAAEPSLGLLATEWVNGRGVEDPPESLADVARLLAAIHALPCPRQEAGYRKAILRYRVLAGADGAEPARLALELLDHLETGESVVTGHNDPTRANIIRRQDAAGSGLVLLDWEYAGPGHASFDLAAVADDFQLDEAGKVELLSFYASSSPPGGSFPDPHVLDTWIRFYRALSDLWSLAVR